MSSPPKTIPGWAAVSVKIPESRFGRRSIWRPAAIDPGSLLEQRGAGTRQRTGDGGVQQRSEHDQHDKRRAAAPQEQPQPRPANRGDLAGRVQGPAGHASTIR